MAEGVLYPVDAMPPSQTEFRVSDNRCPPPIVRSRGTLFKTSQAGVEGDLLAPIQGTPNIHYDPLLLDWCTLQFDVVDDICLARSKKAL
ncbi:hypothetical protein PCANC_07921 [Puccinia coronata f. sp. avenae]|jgi:hypothetical protein|uniref:Uncharacterized protein n=1 Tax=Puccinia coronata f. sp. avenae TaxID=200324 RepID=A0A2N5UYA6_9BASI|nr:hypothetical protein PCANC_20501 [Puccinia coronata f. sp. avenae]PLW42704.1 hypothetical protein PCANC_07921 [Puccinia coronata f. sp. avenae]